MTMSSMSVLPGRVPCPQSLSHCEDYPAVSAWWPRQPTDCPTPDNPDIAAFTPLNTLLAEPETPPCEAGFSRSDSGGVFESPGVQGGVPGGVPAQSVAGMGVPCEEYSAGVYCVKEETPQEFIPVVPEFDVSGDYSTPHTAYYPGKDGSGVVAYPGDSCQYYSGYDSVSGDSHCVSGDSHSVPGLVTDMASGPGDTYCDWGHEDSPSPGDTVAYSVAYSVSPISQGSYIVPTTANSQLYSGPHNKCT